MIIADPSVSDAAVLGYLNERGTGPVKLAQIATATGLPRVTIRVVMYALKWRGAVCLLDETDGYGTTRYLIRHLHPDKFEEEDVGTEPA